MLIGGLGQTRKGQIQLSSEKTQERIFQDSEECYQVARKKEKLKQKIKIKEVEETLNSSAKLSKQPYDELNFQNKTSKGRRQDVYKKEINLVKKIDDQNQNNLDKMIKKNNIVTISQEGILKGSFGHNSIIFKHPIVQGSYFLDFKVISLSTPIGSKLYPPSIRVGICPVNYNLSCPLGVGPKSICWQSSNGKIIGDQLFNQNAETYGEGDQIRVEVKLCPPHKHRNQYLSDQESTINFWKNKNLIKSIRIKHQEFYCFAVSLFNYAEIQVQIDLSSTNFLPTQSSCYKKLLLIQNPYQNIQSSKIFHG